MGVNSSKRKKMPNSLAKASKMQRELKYLSDRRAGVTFVTKNIQESRVNWKAGVFEVQTVLPISNLLCPLTVTLDKHLQTVVADSDGRKP